MPYALHSTPITVQQILALLYSAMPCHVMVLRLLCALHVNVLHITSSDVTRPTIIGQVASI